MTSVESLSTKRNQLIWRDEIRQCATASSHSPSLFDYYQLAGKLDETSELAGFMRSSLGLVRTDR